MSNSRILILTAADYHIIVLWSTMSEKFKDESVTASETWHEDVYNPNLDAASVHTVDVDEFSERSPEMRARKKTKIIQMSLSEFESLLDSREAMMKVELEAMERRMVQRVAQVKKESEDKIAAVKQDTEA